MKRQISKGWSAMLLALIITAIAMACGNRCRAGHTANYDKFETVRAHIQAWLSELSADSLLISSADVKETIVDDWAHQKENYQVVSVRNPDDYRRAGHIPTAINIYWIDILSDESMARLNRNKMLVLYCYYGHASMLTGTILNLLGYRCKSLSFGMMDWNLAALVKEPWDQEAEYEMEMAENRSQETYLPPVIVSEQSDARGLIKDMVRKYFSGEGSPVIPSTDVKAIIDDWDRQKDEYQIVDVRSEREYLVGHIPHSQNIPWADIADRGNLRKLDVGRTIIVYSENGQTGQLASTILNLLGYRAVDMTFGLMDWNRSYVDRAKRWDGESGYPVEYRD